MNFSCVVIVGMCGCGFSSNYAAFINCKELRISLGLKYHAISILANKLYFLCFLLIAERVVCLPCTGPTQVRLLSPQRAWQATESILPKWQGLASYLWHIRYAKNSSKSHNRDVTGVCSNKLMNKRTTVLLNN